MTKNETALREALKLALEALETYKGFIDDAHIIEGQWHWIEGLDTALRTAIKEALEQPSDSVEQEPVAKYIGECNAGSLVQLYEEVIKDTLLYTTPPKCKEWIGLTQDQVDDLAEDGVFLGSVYEITRAIEAKLKELNNE